MNFGLKSLPDLHRRLRRLAVAFPIFLLSFCSVTLAQASWTAVGPPGGDARVIASVPGDSSHLYLGTTASWIYESLDGGAHWRRLAKLDDDNDLVLDHIVVDAECVSMAGRGLM